VLSFILAPLLFLRERRGRKQPWKALKPDPGTPISLAYPHPERVIANWAGRFRLVSGVHMNLRHSFSCVAGALCLSALAGCAVAPHALTADEIANVNAADRAAVDAERPALEGPLTLSGAIARALKYNLDHRTRLLEQAYAAGVLDTTAFDLLPKLTAGVTWSSRSNDPIRRSVDSVTGEPDSSHPFISSERTHTVSELGLSWNLLDFGLSYYNARIQADRVLIASEQRRKAMHELVEQVQSAYWRALSAQMLYTQTREAIAGAESALADARQVEAEKLRTPMESLRYQRALLENLRTLESVDRELSAARFELAGLVGLPAGSDFTLAETGDSSEALPALNLPIETLEAQALANNPDLHNAQYNARIAALETRAAILRLLPGLQFDYGYQRDSDKFLINEDWTQATAQVSANLLSLAALPAKKRLGKAGEALANNRRMAVQMALLTQVHVAAYDFESARHQFQRADEVWRVDDRMLALADNAQSVQRDSQLTQIATRTSAILSLLRRYQALAAMHAAAGKLQATLGIDPTIDSLDTLSLEALTQQIEDDLAAPFGQHS